MTIQAIDVAACLLNKVDEESGDVITHLKLQKLLYYCQGTHLALFNTPFFPERIEAWQHGPVVPDIYSEFNKFGSNAIPIPECDKSKFNKEQLDLIDEVYEVYGQFSAWKLRNLTHDEAPWAENYKPGFNNVISHEDLKNYFLTVLE